MKDLNLFRVSRLAVLIVSLFGVSIVVMPTVASAGNQTSTGPRTFPAYESTGEVDGIVSLGEWPDEPDLVLPLTVWKGGYAGDAKVNIRREGLSVVMLIRYFSWPDAHEQVGFTVGQGDNTVQVSYQQNHPFLPDGISSTAPPGSEVALQTNPDGHEVVAEILLPVGHVFDSSDEPLFFVNVRSRSKSPVVSEFFTGAQNNRLRLVDPLTPPVANGDESEGWGTADVDGTISPGEWDNATVVPFEVPGSETEFVNATLRVLNDGVTGFVAVELPVPAQITNAKVAVDIDLDGDGVPASPINDARFSAWEGGSWSSHPPATETVSTGGAAESTLVMEGSFELGSHQLSEKLLGLNVRTALDSFSGQLEPKRPRSIPLALAPQRELTFMTLNTASETPTHTIAAPTMDRLERLADLIVAEQVDVAAFQEFDHQARGGVDSPAVLRRLLAERNYPMEYRYLARYNPPLIEKDQVVIGAAYYGQAVFSRYPIEDYTETFGFQASPLGGPDIAPNQDIEYNALRQSFVPVQEFRIRPDSQGPAISVLNMHLPLKPLQCTTLARFAQLIAGDIDRTHVISYDEFGVPKPADPTLHIGEPSLLMGDTNIPYTQPGWWGCQGNQWSNIFGQGWVNACAEHQGRWENCPSLNLPNKTNQIDQLTYRDYNGHLTLTESRVVFEYNKDYGSTGLSDHHPILAKFTYNPEVTP